MKLVKFDKIIKEQYLEYITEWEQTGGKIVPWASQRRDMSFKELQLMWKEHETDVMYEKDLVPGTLYFLIDKNNRILGSLGFRYELNDELRKYGGHIGYGVRPSERRKGYATLMLETALDIARKKGYDRILITCDTNNVGSRKTLENNGGKLEFVYMRNDVETRGYGFKL